MTIHWRPIAIALSLLLSFSSFPLVADELNYYAGEPTPAAPLLDAPTATPSEALACCAPDGCCDCGALPWVLSAEALWLQRANGQPQITSQGLVGGPIERAYVGGQFQPGVRLSLQRFDEQGDSCELSYFGLQQWRNDRTVLGDPIGFTSRVFSPSLGVDDIIGGFDTSVNLSYRAQTHNAELNRWFVTRDDGPWTVKAMFGARYFNFEERIAMTGIDSQFGSETLSGGAFNYLMGGQVGLRAERTWDRLSIFGLGKAGLYGNRYSVSQRSEMLPNVGVPIPPFNFQNEGGRVAGILESQVGARFELTDWLAIRGGYNVFYVPGVVLQPSPSGANPGESRDLVLHGASAGVDLVW